VSKHLGRNHANEGKDASIKEYELFILFLYLAKAPNLSLDPGLVSLNFSITDAVNIIFFQIPA